MLDRRKSAYHSLYKASRILITITVILLFAVLFYVLTSYMLDRKRDAIDYKLNQLHRLSDGIKENMMTTADMFQEIYTNPTRLKTDIPESTRFFKRVGDRSIYFYGIGYALNPKYKDYGAYIYMNDNDEIVVDSMEDIYHKTGESYYQRPWFIRALQEKKSFFLSPQPSKFGNLDYTVTYCFPLMYKDSVYAVGVIDVSMSAFFKILSKEAKSDSDVEVFYVSQEYDDHPRQFISLDDDKSNVATEHLNWLYSNQSIKFSQWSYEGGYLYNKAIFMNGAFSFIIKINIIPLIFKMIFILLLVSMSVLLISYYLRRFSKETIKTVTLPIESLLDEVGRIAAGNLESRVSVATGIYELDKLSSSIDSMRSDICSLIQKEKENEHMKAGIELASRIQSAFLSQSESESKNIRGSLDIYSSYEQGNIISGDIYLVHQIEDTLYIFIGDASGKDVAASIFSLFVLARFKILSNQLMNPQELLTELNDYLCEFNSETMFITATCCKIDMKTMECIISNAGHACPLLYSGLRKEVQEISCDTNLVLGVISGYRYTQTRMILNRDEEIILCTDGVTEAVYEGEYYGQQGLVNFIHGFNRQSTLDPAKALISDVACFNLDGKDKDDRTVIWIRNPR
ncbi:SpoIIE family protein phosphatase [Dongshaea marina]|uniref:SpoIIE family protein phosphatase n=1 Tax=Dongshaea marina TaxID=2047966 RepID=UPI00131ED86F|nr:SpoIIE family protein phosphatase [Dongshaea marina]